jgi:thiosulfate/3-mercaptopyruvate sulfurtransferase
MDKLVSTEWLAEHLEDKNIRIVDVRWYLFEKDKTGREEYGRGHIPGAVFLDIDLDLALHGASGPGRHPLPREQEFARSIEHAGISAGTHVVAYDDRGGATAARLWWLLRYYGHDNVSLLDGGIAQWATEGRPLETNVPTVSPGTFKPRANPGMVVDKSRVTALRNDPSAVILDSRVPERYRGDIEPIDARAGHIPGAKNAPLAGNLKGPSDTRFLDPDKLRERYEQLGVTRGKRIVAYCGSGVNACQTLFALSLAGIEDALLYEGSWSDWSRDANLPLATGDNTSSRDG